MVAVGRHGEDQNNTDSGLKTPALRPTQKPSTEYAKLRES